MTCCNHHPRPAIALAIVSSNTTAIAAELVAGTAGYETVFAITRRNTKSALPVLMDGEAWAGRLKRIHWYEAGKQIAAFWSDIDRLVAGREFDCLIHHSTDPFSQLLSGHPLCRKYFYIEEGITALVGGKFGRPVKRPVKKMIWDLKSRIFYGNRINRYRDFFDTRASNYGGCYALSGAAFKGFPGRCQLPMKLLAATVSAPADVLIFLDSQYFRGNCTVAEYASALSDCLAVVLTGKSSAAIKFHPGELDESRKRVITAAVREVGLIVSLKELPPGFIGERMAFDPSVKIIVGTSALGFYLGDRGFQTFTFSPRLVSVSPKFARMMKEIPAEFMEVCKGA